VQKFVYKGLGPVTKEIRRPLAYNEKIAKDRSASDTAQSMGRLVIMKIRIFFVIALMAVSSLASAQEVMKKATRPGRFGKQLRTSTTVGVAINITRTIAGLRHFKNASA